MCVCVRVYVWVCVCVCSRTLTRLVIFLTPEVALIPTKQGKAGWL